MSTMDKDLYARTAAASSMVCSGKLVRTA